jgi:hypothetical protein
MIQILAYGLSVAGLACFLFMIALGIRMVAKSKSCDREVDKMLSDSSDDEPMSEKEAADFMGIVNRRLRNMLRTVQILGIIGSVLFFAGRIIIEIFA